MQLHDYQQEAVRFLLTHRRAALFLDMGLGKTLIALKALDALCEKKPDAKCLVVAPKGAAVTTWMREPQKFRELLPHLDPPVCLAGGVKKRMLGILSGSNLKIINRETLKDLIKEEGGLQEFDALVIDELTSFKSHSSQRFKSLSKALHPKMAVWGLTGTPAAEGLEDLWAQIYLLDGGKRLGKSFYKFLHKFFVPASKDWRTGVVYRWRPREVAAVEIAEAISDITLRMEASQYLDMPRLVEEVVEVPISPRVKSKYRDLLRHSLSEVEAEGEGSVIVATHAASLVSKLHQMASGTVYFTTDGLDKKSENVHSLKLEALKELIEEAQEPVLVAYWYKSDLPRLLELEGARELKTSQDVDAWNNGEIKIGVLQPASMGHGINLQAGGRILVFYTPIFSAEVRQQTIGRLYRQGQTRPVVVKTLCLQDTVDFDIQASVGRKEDLQKIVLGILKKEGFRNGD